MSFSRAQLKEQGYRRFVSFAALRNGSLGIVPPVAGTYAVVAEGVEPEFLPTNRGGHFKGKDPTVSIELLKEKWVDGASVVYVGKAENLQRRLKEFCRFGAGDPIGHWGGRYPVAGRRQ